MPALPGYYTTKEAAEKLGYKTPDSLRQYCAQGKIPGAQNIGRMWFIPVEWVERKENEPIDPKGNRGLARESKKWYGRIDVYSVTE